MAVIYALYTLVTELSVISTKNAEILYEGNA